METLAVDPRMAMDAAAQQDLVQRRQNIDAMRKRLGDNQTEEQQLRDSCEGFEAIFLQKMWEQMRKNVPKEGYLHSKDEEMYQSMFDVELCKKMTSAGGIGLADMLYEQLSQKLANTGRGTTPSAARPAVVVQSSQEYLAQKNAAEETTKVAAAGGAGAPGAPGASAVLAAENLYSEIATADEADNQETKGQPEGEADIDAVLAALKELEQETQKDEAGAGTVAAATTQAVVSAASLAAAGQTADPAKGNTAPTEKELSGLRGTSWQGPGRVFATPKPINPFRGRLKESQANQANQPAQEAQAAQNSPAAANAAASGQAFEAQTAKASAQAVGGATAPLATSLATPVVPGKEPAVSSSMAEKVAMMPTFLPGEPAWPLEGRVASRFGWHNDPATGKRDWNPGVTIETAPGSSVVAALPGKVAFQGPAEGYSNLVVLEHGDNYRSFYGNVNAPALKVGDPVQGGMIFAKTEKSPLQSESGENLASVYFALKRGEMALNPEAAIPKM